ncbi:MAG: hypothetical protein MRECE_12c002 [Mycoplasmataceae bacterium CE_OT135]|nr:MAG: hypothetical protein MRECE_12c002 [Mycoplasmataceae bacterium CE_OT135]
MEERKKIKEENKKAGDDYYNFGIVLWSDYQPGFYKKTPFTTIADDLIKAYQDQNLEKLVIITSSRNPSSQNEKTNEKIKATVKEKMEQIKNTFGLFPDTEVSLSWVEKDSDGRLHPHRWEVIRDKHPDFDMYIDDNPSLVANSPSTLKFMNQIPNIKDKIFVLNDYKSNRKVTGPNIYHVKTEVSDLKDEDFAKAAEEYKKNQAAKEKVAQEPKKNEQVSERERERERERATIFEKNPIFIWPLLAEQELFY